MSVFKGHNLFMQMMAWMCSLFSLTVLAQSDPTGEKRVTGTYAITNATVFTSPGHSVTQATIVIKNGLIEDLGKNIKIPIEAREINGDSLFVYAGFIDVAGNAGVGKPATPERPNDFDPSDPPHEIVGITPYREVLDDFDAEGEEIADWRKEGFTLAQLVPKGDGMMPGKTAIAVYGQKGSSNIIAASAGFSSKFDAIRGMYPGTTLGIMAKWRDLYKNAELSAEHQILFASNSGIIRPEKNKVLESFFPVIDKEVPVIFEVSDELETRRALALQREMGFNLVLTGVSEGTSLISTIKEANVQVVLSLILPKDKASKKEIEDASSETTARLDRVKEAYKNSLKLASQFEKEDVAFAFGTQSAKSEDFMKNMRLMIENGLSEEGALAALTINAAKILNMDKITGSIEKGKLANLVITTDSLFKKGSQIKHVFADGYLFDYEDTDKQKEEKDEDDPVSGSWDYAAETPEGSSAGMMTLKKKPDGYQGTITFDDPEGGGKKTNEMKNIEWSGNTLKFDFDVDVKGMHISVTVSGDISGEEYEGKLSIPDFGSFPFRATKTPDSNHNI
ncbi:MAG: amidohydrolase family protein [Anditalea sp.]